MGIRSYVRDRKQVKASRAGEAREKLSTGDFSAFGGQNGASVDPFSDDANPNNSKSWGPQPSNAFYKNPKPKREVPATHYPKNADGDLMDEGKDEFADMGYGRPGTSAENAEKEPETRGEEAARGAAMPGPAGVTVLGPKHHFTGERSKLDGETRGRVRAANANAKQSGESSDNEDYLPTLEDVERVKREDSTPKPKPRLKAWDED
jgi:hypothetical protein